jgi:DNA-binding phage protein
VAKGGQVKNRRSRAPAIRGICKAAADLGVTRQHLYLVLNGERTSPRLLKAYRRMQRGRGVA